MRVWEGNFLSFFQKNKEIRQPYTDTTQHTIQLPFPFPFPFPSPSLPPSPQYYIQVPHQKQPPFQTYVLAKHKNKKKWSIQNRYSCNPQFITYSCPFPLPPRSIGISYATGSEHPKHGPIHLVSDNPIFSVGISYRMYSFPVVI